MSDSTCSSCRTTRLVSLDAIVGVVDACDRALAVVGDATPELVQGMEMIRTSALDAAAELGATSFTARDTTFDPHQHESVGSEPGQPDGEICRVIARGWRQGARILRPAQVILFDAALQATIPARPAAPHAGVIVDAELVEEVAITPPGRDFTAERRRRRR